MKDKKQTKAKEEERKRIGEGGEKNPRKAEATVGKRKRGKQRKREADDGKRWWWANEGMWGISGKRRIVVLERNRRSKEEGKGGQERKEERERERERGGGCGMEWRDGERHAHTHKDREIGDGRRLLLVASSY